MLNIDSRYSPASNSPTAPYPFGSFRDDSVPGNNDGTPLQQDWQNDPYGFWSALMDAAGLVPDGNPDEVGASQRLEALQTLFLARFTETTADNVLTATSGDQAKDSGVPIAELLKLKGNWNASTNTPDLTTTPPPAGNVYVVSVAGATSLGGITDWKVNDWAVSLGAGAWTKINNFSPTGNYNVDNLISLQDRKAQNVAPQTLVAGTFQTHDLNSTPRFIGANMSGVAVSGNQVVGLPNGTYILKGWTKFHANALGLSSAVQVYNSTLAAVIDYNSLDSNSSFGAGSYPVDGVIPFEFVAVLAGGPTTLELKQFSTLSNAAGTPSNIAGLEEIYTQFDILRVK